MTRAAMALVLLAFCRPALGSDAESELWSSLFRGQAVLVGETHKRLESLDLMRRVVTDARSTHRCVTLALEIPADQQGQLDQIAQGTAPVDEIVLWPMIDFPAYRVYLNEMLQLSREVECFRVIAVDLPTEAAGSRDAAMTAAIRHAIDAGSFVVVQVGALHAVRGLRYRSSPKERNLADRLKAAKLDVRILGELWPTSCRDALAGASSIEARTYAADLERLISGHILPGQSVDAVQIFCAASIGLNQ